MDNQDTTLNLTKIEAPILSKSKYGENIKKQFENIDDNFRKLSNKDFQKGDAGIGIASKHIVMWYVDDNNVKYLTDAAIEILKAIIEYKTSKSAPDFGSKRKVDEIEGILNAKIGDEYKYPALRSINGKSLLTGITDNDQYICDIGTSDQSKGSNDYTSLGAINGYTFLDSRLDELMENSNDINDYSSIIDMSCVVYKANVNNTSKYEVLNNIPTIYWDGNVNDFCWMIGSYRTGMIARGPAGKDGANRNFRFVRGTERMQDDLDKVKITQHWKNNVFTDIAAEDMNLFGIGDTVIVAYMPEPEEESEEETTNQIYISTIDEINKEDDVIYLTAVCTQNNELISRNAIGLSDLAAVLNTMYVDNNVMRGLFIVNQKSTSTDTLSYHMIIACDSDGNGPASSSEDVFNSLTIGRYDDYSSGLSETAIEDRLFIKYAPKIEREDNSNHIPALYLQCCPPIGESDTSLGIGTALFVNEGNTVLGTTYIGMPDDMVVDGVSGGKRRSLITYGDLIINCDRKHGDNTPESAQINGLMFVYGNTTIGTDDRPPEENADLTVFGMLTVHGVTALGATTINGKLTVDNDLSVVKGTTTLGTTTINGKLTVDNDLSVTGDVTLGATTIGSSTTNKNLTVNGDLSVTGDVTLGATTLGATTIGTPVVKENLTVNGDITATGSITSPSDYGFYYVDSAYNIDTGAKIPFEYNKPGVNKVFVHNFDYTDKAYLYLPTLAEAQTIAGCGDGTNFAVTISYTGVTNGTNDKTVYLYSSNSNNYPIFFDNDHNVINTFGLHIGDSVTILLVYNKDADWTTPWGGSTYESKYRAYILNEY